MARRRRCGPFEIAGVALLALICCGGARVRSVERWQATVESSKEVSVEYRDGTIGKELHVVLRRDDCPTEQLQLEITSGPNLECLRGLAVGQHLEVVDVRYKHSLMSCAAKKPKIQDAIGPCSKEGVGFRSIGTACPRLDAGVPPP